MVSSSCAVHASPCEVAMTSQAPRWPWYYHLIVVLFCVAMSAFYVWLSPGHQEARIGLVVVAVLLATILAIQWQKRRHLTK